MMDGALPWFDSLGSGTLNVPLRPLIPRSTDARNCTAAPARRFPASLLPSSSLESRSDQPQTVLRLPVPASHAFSALQRLDEQPGRWYVNMEAVYSQTHFPSTSPGSKAELPFPLLFSSPARPCPADPQPIVGSAIDCSTSLRSVAAGGADRRSTATAVRTCHECKTIFWEQLYPHALTHACSHPRPHPSASLQRASAMPGSCTKLRANKLTLFSRQAAPTATLASVPLNSSSGRARSTCGAWAHPSSVPARPP